MKRNNKKGFTITELVIVIAVIAILAAVLIPTFSGVIDKAKKSSADQTVRNALSVMLYEDEDATLDEGTYYFVYKEGNTEHCYKYEGGKLVDVESIALDGVDAEDAIYSATATARIILGTAATVVQYADLSENVEVICIK